MKHRLSFILAYWWVLLLGAVGLGLLCFAPRDARASQQENRMLQAMPVLSAETLKAGNFMSEFETYLADAFFGRSALISVSNGIRDGFSALPADAVQDGAEELVEALLADDDTLQEGQTSATPSVEIEDTPLNAEQTEGETSRPVATDVHKARFYMCNADGSETPVYAYPEENIQNAAKVLNAYRDALPKDGNVYFFQVPFAETGRSWTEKKQYVGWCSTVEDVIAQYVEDGVFVMNTPAILSPHMEEEQLYFFTDHHWTPRGANYAVSAAQELCGVPALPYDEYTYQSGMRALNAKYENTPRQDRLEILELLEPAESWVVSRLYVQSQQPSVLLDIDAGYMAFLNGTRGPWRRLLTGYHTGRKALIICDSYGNSFSPYLFPYYDEVHMVDYRVSYYSMQEAGADTREYLEAYGIDDVYFVLSTASGINSRYMLEYMLKYLDY